MQMKTYLLVAVLFTVSFVSFAQQNTDEFKRQQYIFEKSVTFNDPVVARMALYNMMAMQPNNLDLLDSLAVFYFNYDIFTSALIVSKEASRLQPDNELALEIAAISFENLRMKDRALDEFQSLFLKNDNLFTLYKVALLQYELARYNECNTSTDILLKRKDIAEATVTFTTEDDEEREIGIDAAIYNLKGMTAAKQADKTAAKAHFQKALELAPLFDLAANNMKDLDNE